MMVYNRVTMSPWKPISRAKRWINMAQVLQDVADMSINFKRSQVYSLLTLNVNHITSSNNYSSVNSHRSTKPPTKDIQQLFVKVDKPKCWHCQGDHLKKDCPTAPHQNGPSQSKYKLTRERHHNLIKSF